MAVDSGGPIVVGFAEALAGIETAWSLVESGHQIVAFTRRGRRPPLRRCPAVRVVEITAPEQDAQGAVADVRRAVAETGAWAIMPLDDHALWLCDRAAADGDTVVIGPTGERASFALDKRVQLAAAARAGLRVARTLGLDGVDDVAEFPVVVKPAHAVAEREGRLVRGGALLCGDRSELLRAAASVDPAEDMLVQPLLEGVGEGLFGIAGDRGVSGWSAHRRVRMMNPRGSGSSACEPTTPDPEEIEAVERMLAETGWRGLFMVELLRDRAGAAWFMELNGRPWGSMALARRMGLEYPAWAAAQALDPEFEVPEPAPADPVRCRHLGRELVHLLIVLRGPRPAALPCWPSRSRALREILGFRRRDRFYNLRRGGLALFLDDTLQTVAGTVRRRRSEA